MSQIKTHNTRSSIRSLLTLTTASLALIAGEALFAPQIAFADDCLLDTNDNGSVNTSDTDGGADSNGVDGRLACGVGATASGANSTALGGNSEASGLDSLAVGNEAVASGNDSSALGRRSTAAG